MIARHMKDPQEVETEIKLMPSINAGGLGGRKMPEAGAEALTPKTNWSWPRWASTPRPMPTRQRRCTERATDMAASNDIRSRRKPGLGRTYGYPVLTGVVLYGGAAIAVTAERNAVPVGHANAVKFVGFAAERVDNSLGATGEQTVTVERDVPPDPARWCRRRQYRRQCLRDGRRYLHPDRKHQSADRRPGDDRR